MGSAYVVLARRGDGMAKKKSDAGEGSGTPPPENEGQKPYVVLARKYRPQTFDDLIGQSAMVTNAEERVRRRSHRARLHAHRRPRRGKDHHGPYSFAPRLNYEREGVTSPRSTCRSGQHFLEIMEAGIRTCWRWTPPPTLASTTSGRSSRARDTSLWLRAPGLPDRRSSHALQGRPSTRC